MDWRVWRKWGIKETGRKWIVFVQPKLHKYKQKYDDGYKSVTSKDTRPCDTWKTCTARPERWTCISSARTNQGWKRTTDKGRQIKRSKKSAKTSDTPHYQNVPFEVPSSWVWCKLEDYVKSVTDGDHQAPPKSDIGIPFLVISDVAKGKLNS